MERPAQVQGHRHDTNEEPAELSGGRRRYDETDFLQVEIEGVMRFTKQDRKNLQVVFTKQDQVDQVEGGDPDDNGKGEKETSSENSDTEEEDELNQVIQGQVWGIGVKNQELLAVCGLFQTNSLGAPANVRNYGT